jgi:glucose-1-phosphate adenylyltransferase
MGIYVFKKDLMLKLLREQGKSNDFGGEIIPSAAASSRVMAYLFNGYWEDIGTIKSFFEANLGLAQQVLNARRRPQWQPHAHLPHAKRPTEI